MTFSEMLDRFQEESAVLDLKQRVERLQFEVDFWANAESGEGNRVEASRSLRNWAAGISKASYQRRGATAKEALHRAREDYRQRTGTDG